MEVEQSASDELFPDETSVAAKAVKKRAAKPQPRVRDEVFWTELEIRRLSNLVAEAIHSRRYVGTSLAAVEERQKMRVYIDAMKRKAMRVLHRAELFARSVGAAWPGIDRSIADPVSLADEYVRLVEDYMGVITAEEERVRKESLAEVDADAGATEDANGTRQTTESTAGDTEEAKDEKEDWEVEDESAYRKAMEESQRQPNGKDHSLSEDRKELLSGATKSELETDGVRRRRGTDTPGGGEQASVEEEMARNQPIQDELTSKLADMVGQLKESVTDNKTLLDKDKSVLDETEDAVDRNVSAIGAQRKRLGAYSQRTATSWWTILIAAFVIIVVFLFVFVLLAAPM